MKNQPLFLEINYCNKKKGFSFMIGSNSCLHYIDLANDTEYDLDYLYKISDIRSVIFCLENNKYYVFANRSKGFLG